MKTALITSLGQDGSYLAEHLLDLGYRVFATIRSQQQVKWWVHPLIGRVDFVHADLRDEMSLRTAILKSWPDEIYNLAGQVFVPLSWQMPAETMDVNAAGLLRILKVVEEIKRDTRVYQASTSEMFGEVDGPCSVDTPFTPRSPYGVSKVAAHGLVRLYRERGLYVVGGILFNHESPRRNQEMVTRKMARAAAQWSTGDVQDLYLGNMDAKRDWGYAREYVRAMHLMLQQAEPRDFVIGTGESHSVRDFLETACEIAGVPEGVQRAHTKVDERLVRKQDIYDMKASTYTAQNGLGWVARTPFRDLVKLMVEAEQELLQGAMEESAT